MKNDEIIKILQLYQNNEILEFYNRDEWQRSYCTTFEELLKIYLLE